MGNEMSGIDDSPFSSNNGFRATMGSSMQEAAMESMMREASMESAARDRAMFEQQQQRSMNPFASGAPYGMGAAYGISTPMIGDNPSYAIGHLQGDLANGYTPVSKEGAIGQNMPKALTGEVPGTISSNYRGPPRNAIINYPCNPINAESVSDWTKRSLKESREKAAAERNANK